MSTDEPDASPAETPTVTVVGSASLRTEPDEALLDVTLSALYPSPGEALADVAGRAQGLTRLLDEMSIAVGDRSTSGIGVAEEFDHGKQGRRSVGHRARSSVVVRTTALETIGRLITRVTTELGAQVDGPHWQVAPDNPVHLAVARAASADARRRAEAYAGGVGARLGRLLELRELGAGEAGPRRMKGMRRAMVATSARPDMTVETGEREVTAAIEVTYALR